MSDFNFSRRNLFVGGGSLVVWFSLAGCGAPARTSPTPAPGGPPPESPATAIATAVSEQAPAPTQAAARAVAANQLDGWLAIDQNGFVTAFSGKVELGTGVTTALAQIVAEELDVPFERVRMVMGDTQRTPDEGYTAGSKTIQVGGVALRKASAEARRFLLNLASQRLGVPADQLQVKDGFVGAQSGGAQPVSYGELIGGQKFNHVVPDQVPTANPATYDVVGKPIPRVELPAKVTGTWTYIQDVRVPDMLHGRVIRPYLARETGIGARLDRVDENAIRDISGIVRVVRDGSFLGVVAQTEWAAIQAARRLQPGWRFEGNLPAPADVFEWTRNQGTQDREMANTGDVEGALRGAARSLQASYQWPYQAHASIGPSCAVADVRSDRATIWSPTQGVYPLRGAIAQLLGMATENVHVVHVEGAGCYGHNGFDDVSGDAALLSRAVGRPVRVQWMRQDEFGWEPKCPAMVMEVKAGLDSQGAVAAWDYGVWTPTHSTRPGGQAANLLPGKIVERPSGPARNNPVGGDRNAPTNYTFRNNRVVAHWLSDSVLRPSALRTLGGAPNTFANESFMDELAAAAGADPVEFRLRHLDDPRAIDVVRAAARLFGWQSRSSPRSTGGSGVERGQGFAFSRYENNEAYVATAVEVEVDRGSGAVRVVRMAISQDAGLIINPDGITNQLEGNALQSASRALKEQILWDENQVTTLDWARYPILRFNEIFPVAVELINRPDQPAWGAGEPATENTAPAIANAIFDAVGVRIRAVPFTPDRVAQALSGV